MDLNDELRSRVQENLEEADHEVSVELNDLQLEAVSGGSSGNYYNCYFCSYSTNDSRAFLEHNRMAHYRNIK